MRWVLKLLGGTAIFVAVCLLCSGAYQWYVVSHFESTFPYPGELVDVGGHSLHLNCSGNGAGRTVILEAGSGMWSLDWHEVQRRVSQFTAVCSYDRAGHGWSEFGDEPRTIDRLVEELGVLLDAADLPPPYLMVGASFGGSIVQLYEHRHPEKVAGIVLVDARPKGYTAALREIVPEAVDAMTEERAFVSGLFDLGLVSIILKLQGPFTFSEQPEHLARVYAHAGRLTKHTAAHARELSVDPISDDQMQLIGSIGNKPLTVIVHGEKTMFRDQLGLTDEEAMRMEAIWIEQQKQLLKLSSRSELLVAETSGHLVHQDQPDLIVDAIRRHTLGLL